MKKLKSIIAGRLLSDFIPMKRQENEFTDLHLRSGA